MKNVCLVCQAVQVHDVGSKDTYEIINNHQVHRDILRHFGRHIGTCKNVVISCEACCFPYFLEKYGCSSPCCSATMLHILTSQTFIFSYTCHQFASFFCHSHLAFLGSTEFHTRFSKVISPHVLGSPPAWTLGLRH